jgi:hypothetical protein
MIYNHSFDPPAISALDFETWCNGGFIRRLSRKYRQITYSADNEFKVIDRHKKKSFLRDILRQVSNLTQDIPARVLFNNDG